MWLLHTIQRTARRIKMTAGIMKIILLGFLEDERHHERKRKTLANIAEPLR